MYKRQTMLTMNRRWNSLCY